MIKNLITGPGFVASHLADLLLEKGEEVYITYRWTDNCDSFNHIKDKVHWVLMDLNDLSSCIKAIDEVKPDYIFHLGAQSYPSASFIYPEETIRTNTLGTYNLLEAVRIVRDKADMFNLHKENGYLYNPIIHVCSSSEVYGLVKKEDVPIKETQAFNPANPYAVGKVGEDMIALMYWTNYKIKTIRTRMFTHTGPRRTMLSAEVNFAKQIAEFEKQEKIKPQKQYVLKHGNLDSIRTWADVRDAIQAYYLLVRKGKIGEVYNIGGKDTRTIGEMLDYLISLSPLKTKIKKELDPSLLRPYDVTLQIPDCFKFIKETGWKRTITFEQTMQDLLNWWRQEV
jgi:GDP-mannose 4,6-dehydratase